MNHIIEDHVQDKFSLVNCRTFWVRTKSERCVMQIERMQYSELKKSAIFKYADYCNDQPHSTPKKRNQVNIHTHNYLKTAF